MKHFVILMACLAVLCVQPADAALFSATPTADGYALHEYNTSYPWYGLNTTSTDLDVSVGDFVGDLIEARSALEFNISSVPSGFTIQSATLYLYASLSDANIGVYGYIGNGTIELGDFTDILPMTTAFDPGPVNVIDVTGFVSGLFPSGTNFVGFQLKELNPPDYNDFFSSEAGIESLRPRLEIVYAPASVPEPSTMLLLGSGLIGLVGYGRRRFKK